MKIQANPTRPTVAPGAAATRAAAEAAPAAVAANAGWTAKKVSAAAPTTVTDPGARTRAVAENYFKAFEARDTEALKTFYRPDSTFHDDMFTLSKGESIVNMWKKAPPFATFKSEIVSATGDEVKAKWTVDYEMFGNKVHNEIESTMKIDGEGKIRDQQEHWDPKKWMKQALPLIPSWAQGLAYMVMRPLVSASVGG